MKIQVIVGLLVLMILSSGCYETPKVLEKSRVQMQEAGDERSQLKIGTIEAIKFRPWAWAGGVGIDALKTAATVYGGYVLSEWHDHEKSAGNEFPSGGGVHNSGDNATLNTIYNYGDGRAWQDQSTGD